MKAKLTFKLAAILISSNALAADQSQPGAGNAHALRTASESHVALAALRYMTEAAQTIEERRLRFETLDALSPLTCVHHRANLGLADKQAILAALVSAGFVSASDASGWSAGALNGVFPPLLADGTACPHVPQPFLATPGSGFHGHHSYPGGLVIHTAMNTRVARSFADNYAENYRDSSTLDHDLVVAAPLWHDWAKPMVFQWNADGSEFAQMTIASSGSHHILGLAEAIARGLSPAHVATQASAHTYPTGSNEALVVGYIRAAAIIARVDALAKGYVVRDAAGNFRLPPVAHLGDIDLLAAGQTNLMAEYIVDNLSDADWIYTEPAVAVSELILSKLASRFGYDPAAANYNTNYRNVVLAELTAERMQMTFQRDGLEAVARLLQVLHNRGKI